MTLVAVGWSALLVAWLASRRRPPRRDGLRGGAPSRVRRPAAAAPTSGRRAARRRRAAIARTAPDLVDLVAVAVAAGLNVRLTVVAVAEHLPPGPLRQELAAVLHDVAGGVRLADALDRLPSRLDVGRGSPDETVRGLVAALVDAERYGTPLGPTLDRLTAEARRSRQRRAEERARRVPVQLLFPLVTCILPAFGLLTVAPLIAGGLRALRL